MIKNEIKILSDIEHCLTRKSMYIGSTVPEDREQFLFGTYQKVTYTPGLVKIIEELINNSVDEAIRTSFKFANLISVSIDQKTSSIIVEDNGRGLPQNLIVTPEGFDVPAAVAAWTRVKAGANFDDSQGFTGAGQNGVGSSLSNIFSTSFIGETCDGKNLMTVTCTNNLSTVDWDSKPKTKKGTKVTIIPDFKHFGCDKIDDQIIDIIKDQLQTLAVTFPEITVKFNGDKITGNFKHYAKMYDEKSIILETPNIQLSIGRSDDGFRHLSYVNSIHTKAGGHHIDYLIDELSNELIPLIKRTHKVEVNKARIKECLMVLLFIKNFPNARFDSQTKERLTSPMSVIKSHFDIDIKKLARQILKNEDILMPIIESVLAKLLAAEKAAATKAIKKAAKAKVSKHIKANGLGNPKVNTTLFLVEGDSAIGFLIRTRNPETTGGYPLRGKVKNTWNETYAEMMSNRELFEICSITGLVLGDQDSKLIYDNIAIFVDADHDGLGSIYPSLLAFFSNWPKLFEEKRIKFCKSPIIIATKNKDVRWYYSLEEYEADKSNLNGYIIRYIKGLGSLTELDYERVINEEAKFDVVELPDDWKDQFEMLMGDDPQLRKDWMTG